MSYAIMPNGTIKLPEDVTHYEEHTVVFEDGTRIKFEPIGTNKIYKIRTERCTYEITEGDIRHARQKFGNHLPPLWYIHTFSDKSQELRDEPNRDGV